ncbi:hypothetical protein V2K23_18905 [Pseudomonas alliivorans]|nr:hypothetical protein [Pseudomonas alliivorans]
MSLCARYTIDNRPGVCAEHGQYLNCRVEQFGADPIWYGCPRCEFDNRNSADITVRAGGVLVHAERLLNAKLLDACIPVRFQQATLENWVAGSDDAKSRT